MRLPEFLTKISPVGDTLAAAEAGQRALSAAVAEKNAQFTVETATDALSLWEADYGLKDRTGSNAAERRVDIRTAAAGGRTLTPAYLTELATTLGGARSADVEEDFPGYRTVLYTVTDDLSGNGTAALERAVNRLKPAHITVSVIPCSLLTVGTTAGTVLHGSVVWELHCTDTA